MTKAFTLFRAAAFIATVSIPLFSWAGPVSEAEARQKAYAFLQERKVSSSIVSASMRRHQAKAATPTAQNSYYVFNVGSDEGFVIVSGDDRTPEILGYADSGVLSEDNMPDGLRYLLEGYEEQMEWLDANGIDEAYSVCESRGARKAPARTAIAPLIQTRWNQGAPYNKNCPDIPETDGEKTVTGCVATTLAQLMYYHMWPQSATTAIPGYTVTTKDKDKNEYSLTVSPLDATTFSWNDMTKTYTTDATGAAADAVATLMQYCGSALKMTYGLIANGGSSSYSENIPYALKTYFGYDGGVRHAYRKAYSYAEWVSLIYSELSDGRPVALGGQATGGGHSFVCDGYQGDDYFHINWGWGGKSDGYYRLSLLNPYEQGIGGSSTLDGFSYSQDAVIGIQPPVDGNKDYCLSLEGLRLGSSDDASKASQTYTRNSESGGFDISLYFLVSSYHQGSNYFDFAVQLVDGNNYVIQTLETFEKQAIDWSKNSSKTFSRTIPQTVVDGTYYIKVVSRLNGTDAWQECFDGDRYQLVALISGDELTITVPRPATVLPSAATLAVTGDTEAEGYLTQGYEQEVTASITGGTIDYHGNVVLRVNGTAVMGKVLDIPAGQTVDAHFSFIPTKSGDNVLTLYNAKSKGTQIGGSEATTTVNIKESDATDNLDLSFTANVDNLSSDGKLYGNALRATVTVENSSSTNTYVGKMNCLLRKWTFTTTDNGDNTYSISSSWISTDLNTYPLVVGKKSSKTMAIAFDGLETTDENTRYSVRVTYQNSAIENKVAEGVHLGLDQNEFGTLEVINGYSLGDATGTTTLYAPSAAIDAGNACFVDLTTLGTLDAITVTPSTNPNCLYLLTSGATTPSDLTGKNVVKGTTAESITLTDGNDFYSPIDFTATDISYTRTFSRAATSTGGWNGLYLPFTVSAVTCDGKTIDWFHSDSDTGKNFWLKTMTGDDSGTVYFDFADALTANTPYIIALPGSDFGERQLTGKGKAITFSGTNADIKATETGSLSGNNYKFCGSTVGQSHSDAYMLNTTGTRFIKGTATLPAFRAWIEAANISSLSRTALVIGDGDIQGISVIENDKEKNDSWYTLDGRKVNPASAIKKGIYIKNGKTIIR